MKSALKLANSSEQKIPARMPSLGNRCPRRILQGEPEQLNWSEPCGYQMIMRQVEHMHVWTCPSGHYSVSETSSGMRADFIQATHYEYLSPTRGSKVRLG